MRRIHKIITYKTLLAIMALCAALLLLDNFLPVKVAKEKMINGYWMAHRGRYGSGDYKNYFLETEHFKFETSNIFFYRSVDSVPITIYYSPLLKVVKRVEALNSDSGAPMKCEAKNTLFNALWMFPVVVLVISTGGLFVSNKHDDKMMLGVSLFFAAVLIVALYSNYAT